MQPQQPDNSNNVMLAVVLSMAVLLIWQVFYAGPRMKEEQARVERERQTQTQTQPGTGGAPATAPQPTAGAQAPVAPPAAGTAAPTAVPAPAAVALTREAALKLAPRLAIDTPSLKGSISLKGGRVDDLVLAKYRETVDPRSPQVVLFQPAEAAESYFAEHGWVGQPGSSLKLPDRDTVWKTEQAGPLTPDKPVTLTWDNGQGLVFKRTFAVDSKYMIKVADEVENRTGAEVTLFPYGRIYRHATPKVQGFYILHEGLIGFAGDAGLQEITYADAVKDGGSKSLDKVTGGWLGMTDKYWAAALVPNQKDTYRASFSGSKRKAPGEHDTYQTDYLMQAVAIPAGGSNRVESNLYAGAKEVKVIEDYEATLGIRQFDLMIDWGWFYFITKPLFFVLDWLYRLLGNFGLAILATTVLVKLAFFPLANKSYESMAKMKKLQPEMERLRDRFKDDKARQQQELMQLYQKEKINPLAGCLPILVQIPVFFALYKVLFVTIDMRHAPFVGWIKDLSAPDPTSLFNLFGLLPYAVPDFLMIGVWPLLMGVTMWLQMQLNPPQPDPTQQMIFNWMPVMFTFLLASFPAGLVIYWAWNNVLSLLQQSYIMKKQGTEIHLMDNVKRTFGPLFGRKDAKPGAKR
jgi:YidC/Oxa1 family membrane protein insertase